VQAPSKWRVRPGSRNSTHQAERRWNRQRRPSGLG
jgi:hypothetical protein